MATSEYISSFSGQQVDDALTKATMALQPADILDTSGINTKKAISQNACTNLFNQFIYNAVTNPNPTPAQNTTNVTTSINGVALSSIFEQDGTTVKNATNAVNLVSGGTIASNVTATTQDASDDSLHVANTAYVTRAVNAIKNIVSGDITISSSFVSPSSITSKSVRRQCDIVTMNLEFVFPQTSWSTSSDVLIATFPLALAPPTDITGTFYALFKEQTNLGYQYYKAKQIKITTLGQIIMLAPGSIQSATSVLLCCGYSMS